MKRGIFGDGQAPAGGTVQEKRAEDGKIYNTQHYNLDVIIEMLYFM